MKNTVLANDLVDCPNDGLYIGANNITLDLNGHTIDGEADGFDSCDGQEICDVGVDNKAGFDRVTIRNGHITDFVDGIAMTDALQSTVEQISTNDLAHGLVFMLASHGSVVRSSHSVDDGGLAYVGESRNVRITNNTIVSNRFGGIATFGSSHVTVSNNTITNTTMSAITLLEGDSGVSHHNRIVGNTVTGGSDGVWLGDGTHHNTVTTNDIEATVSGIHVGEDSKSNVVTRNHVEGTEFSSIDLSAGSENNTVSRNDLSNTGGIEVAGDHNRIVDNTIKNAVGTPDDSFSGFGVAVDGGGDANLIQGNSIDTAAAFGIAVISFEEGETAEGNIVRSNRVLNGALGGILVDKTALGTKLRNNTANDNDADGITVHNPRTRLTANVARNNMDLGINAVDGVTDGGGNRASGNGDTRQCIGVECKP